MAYDSLGTIRALQAAAGADASVAKTIKETGDKFYTAANGNSNLVIKQVEQLRNALAQNDVKASSVKRQIGSQVKAISQIIMQSLVEARLFSYNDFNSAGAQPESGGMKSSDPVFNVRNEYRAYTAGFASALNSQYSFMAGASASARTQARNTVGSDPTLGVARAIANAIMPPNSNPAGKAALVIGILVLLYGLQFGVTMALRREEYDMLQEDGTNMLRAFRETFREGYGTGNDPLQGVNGKSLTGNRYALAHYKGTGSTAPDWWD